MASAKVPKARSDIQLLIDELREVKAVLREAIPAMCSHRAIKGRCSACKDAIWCKAKDVIPKAEKVLKINNDGTIFKL